MQAQCLAANTNAVVASTCLTDADRDLLRVVTGWPMPGEAPIATAADADGKPVLIPMLAWVLADARRSGALTGELTPAAFAVLANRINRARSPRVRLSRAQVGTGFRHLAIGLLDFTAGRARVAAG
jgi:hypothetical protein